MKVCEYWSDLRPAAPELWRRASRLALSETLLLCVPSLLHVVGFTWVGKIVIFTFVSIIAFEVMAFLPRFIRAVRTNTSKPLQGNCLVDWTAHLISLSISFGLAKIVGLF